MMFYNFSLKEELVGLFFPTRPLSASDLLFSSDIIVLSVILPLGNAIHGVCYAKSSRLALRGIEVLKTGVTAGQSVRGAL